MYTPKKKNRKPKSPNILKVDRQQPEKDTLLIDLIQLKAPKAIIKEIEGRKKLGQSRTQIAREMNIPKLHINRILEVVG